MTNTIVQLFLHGTSGVIRFIAADLIGNGTNTVLSGLGRIEMKEKRNSRRLLEEVLTNPPVRPGTVFHVVISSAQESNELKGSQP